MFIRLYVLGHGYQGHVYQVMVVWITLLTVSICIVMASSVTLNVVLLKNIHKFIASENDEPW